MADTKDDRSGSVYLREGQPSITVDNIDALEGILSASKGNSAVISLRGNADEAKALIDKIQELKRVCRVQVTFKSE